MNKGLEALYKFCDDVNACVNSGGIRKIDIRNKDIIEKELKRLEEIDNGAYVSVHINRYNELCDKEKALKIIKKKQVNVSALLELDNLAQYNGYCAVVCGCKRLTQEEYNLLKEVLL